MDNRQRIKMNPQWRPSEIYYQMVTISSIPIDFCNECLAEFILYFNGQERTNGQWESALLKWTRKEYVRFQNDSSLNSKSKDNKPESSGVFQRLTDQSWAKGLQ